MKFFSLILMTLNFSLTYHYLSWEQISSGFVIMPNEQRHYSLMVSRSEKALVLIRILPAQY